MMSRSPAGGPHGHRAVVALGSNLGDRLQFLQDAVDLLADTPGCQVVAVSPVYETDPVGGPEQPRYLNAVVLLDTVMSARTLLERGQTIETVFHRVRRERWGPRTLDVDLITYDDMTYEDQELTVPHPRAHERGFVLWPWHDVDPAAALPGRGRVADLLGAVGSAGICRRDDLELRPPE